MQSYRIVAPHFVAAVIVGGDLVLQSAPILNWSVGKPFVLLRDYSRKRGWIVEPLEETVHPTWLELDGTVYEITWNEDTITGITAHESGEESRELTWDELPSILKDQL